MLAGVAHAGRPLTVDDAGVNETGHGHVEAWFAHRNGGPSSFNLSPAWAPVDGVEVGGLLARESDGGGSTTALQVKWLWTRPVEGGCNLGSVLGIAHFSSESFDSPYASGLMTCDTPLGGLNLNIGALRQPDLGYQPTWGVSLERPFGAMVAHAEMFGQRRDKPVLQFGVRQDLGGGWQIDGTIGRQDGANLLTLGLKRSF